MNCRNRAVALWADQRDELATVAGMLAHLGCQVRLVDSFGQVRARIETDSVDLIVTQLCPCFRGPLDLLSWVKGLGAAPRVLIVTTSLDGSLALGDGAQRL